MTEVTDINSLIKYSSDLSRLNRTIQVMQNSMYSDNEFVWPTGKTDFDNLKSFLENRGVKIRNSSEVGSELETLWKEISQLQKVRVKVVSSEFSEEFWDKVFDWLKQNLVGGPFVLNREYDPSILGGTIITWKGNYFDLSLHTKLNDFFEKDKINVPG